MNLGIGTVVKVNLPRNRFHNNTGTVETVYHHEDSIDPHSDFCYLVRFSATESDLYSVGHLTVMDIKVGSMVLVKSEGDYCDNQIGKVGYMFMGENNKIEFYVEFPETNGNYTSDQLNLLTEEYVNTNYSFPGTRVEILATKFKWKKGTIEHAFIDESLYAVMYSVRLDSGEKETFYLDEFDILDEKTYMPYKSITFEVEYFLQSMSATSSKNEGDSTGTYSYNAKIAVYLPSDENYNLIPELQSKLEFMGSPLSPVWGNTNLSDDEEKRRVKYISLYTYNSWEALEEIISEKKIEVTETLKSILNIQASVPKTTIEVVEL
jgi:hypothetical protein